MGNTMKQRIVKFCLEHNIDILDIKTIKSVALNFKKYDLIAYINTNSQEYITFAKKQLRKP